MLLTDRDAKQAGGSETKMLRVPGGALSHCGKDFIFFFFQEVTSYQLD